MSDPLKLLRPDNYVVQLEVFEGPMDLLLHLIEREELPITSVSLAQITEQYLSYLDELEELHPDGIAEFLVMAARLLYIKSLALLPAASDLEDEEEEDEGEALARQLREYKRFKERAAHLKELEESGRRVYVRLAPPPVLEKRLDPQGLDVTLLLDAVYEVLRELDAPPPPIHSIAPLLVTVEGIMSEMVSQLKGSKSIRFRQFMAQANSRMEVVVGFLAVLEMIKQRQVSVQQEGLFGDIVIVQLADAPALDTEAIEASFT